MVVNILQGFLFPLADAISGLDKIIMPDRFYPRYVGPVIETFVVVTWALVDNAILQGISLVEINDVGTVHAVTVRIAIASRKGGAEHTSFVIQLTAEIDAGI